MATINPGPFLTGFNDRGFQTWESWEDEPSERLYDYSKLAFPRPQFDPAVMIATMTKVVAGEVDSYRNLEPQSMLEETKKHIEAPWTKSVTKELGMRPAQIQKCYDMTPEVQESEWTPRERDGASLLDRWGVVWLLSSATLYAEELSTTNGPKAAAKHP